MRLAKSNTMKNLETCGILAGTLVISLNMLCLAMLIGRLLNIAHVVCAEEQKVPCYSFDNSEAGINIGLCKLKHFYIMGPLAASFV